MSRGLRGAAAVAVILSVLGGCLTAAPAPAADPPVRIMLVGDSITEGSSGDWTWRYRLAAYLDSAGVDYEFVGPRVTMLNLETNEHDSLEYADPAFDQHHFARWGESLHAILDENAPVPEDGIGWAVATYQPDVVIEVLGTNDLLYGSSPQDTLGVAQQFVSEVRAADPDAAVVLSTVPGINYAHFSDYNNLLETTAPQWSTPASPVVVSDPSPGWDSTIDTCDSTHPSAVGEVTIAAAQADALAGLGIGSPIARPLPEPPVGPRVPAVLSAIPGDGQVSLSWQLPPGGTAVLVSARDVTEGTAWQQLPIALGGGAWVSGGLTNGDTYAYRVNVLKHDCIAQDVVSNVVSVVPGPDTPGAVTGLTVDPVDHGFAAQWTAPPGATSYQVWIRPTGQTSWQTFAASSTSYQAGSLRAGAEYDVAVQAVGRVGASPLASAPPVTPTGVVPGAPTVTGVVVRADGTATVSWSRQVPATGYVASRRRARPGAPWVALGSTATGTSAVLLGLRSAQSYLFRVTAYDDRLEGGTSAAVRARVPRVGPVASVAVHRRSATRGVTGGDAVPFATSYLLRGATAPTCGHVPGARHFRTWAGHLTVPHRVFAISGGHLAIWVRWYAVRDGERGRTSARSVACLPPSR
jgi:hypothetical protein